MTADVYLALAMAVLAAHLLFNLWVVFGAAAMRRRPKLAGLHIGSVLYGDGKRTMVVSAGDTFALP
jgi:hypothetical protein